MKVFVTGAAGFIGFNLSKRLLNEGHEVVGIDIINDYYSPALKMDRLAQLTSNPNFTFYKEDISDYSALEKIFRKEDIEYIVHLAAQAGVRYSLINPRAYIDSNIVGTFNFLEISRHFNIKHLVYASSSSVYGLNTNLPFSVHNNVDHPISLYAASKKSNELMAHSYSHLFNIPTTGLRFFTVYGPWGRPDMALFLFTKAIIAGEPINIFNHGKMVRDFTYIDDIVEGIYRIVSSPAKSNPDWDGNNPDPGTSPAPFKIYNIGNNNPVSLMDYIYAIEKALGKEAIKNFMDLQAGDVPETYADVDDLIRDFDYRPSTSIEEGITNFIKWYLDYYKVQL